MLSDASRSLYTALNRRVYFNQATVVVPSNWRDAKCKIQIHAPRSGSSYGVRSSSPSNYRATDRNIFSIRLAILLTFSCHTFDNVRVISLSFMLLYHFVTQIFWSSEYYETYVKGGFCYVMTCHLLDG